ncbi:MAG: response regulator transcription factor [Firmicutes bacterium]|nr:response regulator transcription factor [Bacillota bacterium]
MIWKCPWTGRTSRDFGLTVLCSHPIAAEAIVQSLREHAGRNEILCRTLKDNLSLEIRPRWPHLFVVDACVPSEPPRQLVRHLRLRYPGSRFLVLDRFAEQNSEECLRWIEVGVEGIVDAGRWREELPQALAAVLAGELWVPRRMLCEYIRQNNLWYEVAPLRALTAREDQVLRLLLRRHSNSEIARLLGISERTVKFHMSNIFSRFRVKNRAALLAAVSALRIKAPDPTPSPKRSV